MDLPVRVLILAGDPLARGGLAALLAAGDGLHVVGQASDRDDPRTALDAYRPDVIVWDLGWDVAARLEALNTVAEQGLPVLAILGAGDDSAAVWAAGARGIVGRDVSVERLAAALGALTLGLSVFEPAAATLPIVSRSDPALLPVEALTPREHDVLRGMADGLSNKLIARQLEISEHTVKFHVNAILGKLGAQSRTDAVVRATRAGVLLL